MNSVSYCIGCGCNDDYGCDGGCSWIRLDRKAGLGVCSECEHRSSDWDNGNLVMGSGNQPSPIMIKI